MLKYILTLLPVFLQLLVAVRMYKRRQHLKYFAFWTYLWFESAKASLILCLGRYPTSPAYFWTYWSALFIGTIFILVVMREVFVGLLADYSALTRFQRRGYEICLAIACFISILTAARMPGPGFLVRNTIAIQQAASSVAVIMLLFVVAASIVLGIRWRSELCGIAAGLGLQGIADVVVFTGILQHGGYNSSFVGWIERLAYDLSFVVFAIYFLVPQEEAPAAPLPPQEMTEWVQTMSETIPR